MNKKPDFDVDASHRYFSAECFNRAWDLIDKSDRTPQEDEEMIRLSMASTWHWIQRSDYTLKNLCIGYWQTARVYALLRQVDNARRYGELCLEASQGEDIPPFYLAYAYEALARAEMLAGDREKMKGYLMAARQVAERISDADAKAQLLGDLETIG